MQQCQLLSRPIILTWKKMSVRHHTMAFKLRMLHECSSNQSHCQLSSLLLVVNFREKRLVSVKSKNVCVKQRLFLSHTVCKMDCSTTAVVQQQQKNYRQETESHKSDKKEGNTQTTLMQRAALLLCEMHFLFFAFLLTLATLVLMCQNGKEKKS